MLRLISLLVILLYWTLPLELLVAEETEAAATTVITEEKIAVAPKDVEEAPDETVISGGTETEDALDEEAVIPIGTETEDALDEETVVSIETELEKTLDDTDCKKKLISTKVELVWMQGEVLSSEVAKVFDDAVDNEQQNLVTSMYKKFQDTYKSFHLGLAYIPRNSFEVEDNPALFKYFAIQNLFSSELSNFVVENYEYLNYISDDFMTTLNYAISFYQCTTDSTYSWTFDTAEEEIEEGVPPTPKAVKAIAIIIDKVDTLLGKTFNFDNMKPTVSYEQVQRGLDEKNNYFIDKASQKHTNTEEKKKQKQHKNLKSRRALENAIDYNSENAGLQVLKSLAEELSKNNINLIAVVTQNYYDKWKEIFKTYNIQGIVNELKTISIDGIITVIKENINDIICSDKSKKVEIPEDDNVEEVCECTNGKRCVCSPF